ncbi:helix-turn-helix domain-containing protein [Sphingobacterium thalpophilum]|uniref:helix-turn-helix domain-containing protein n=1 Tax=Sphingobacterium thalpophilum TaxID=259 RepID=UPI002D799AD3|nr:helix-turn-helix transcriptional regulator [Sphingobacterium thalpophilum]
MAQSNEIHIHIDSVASYHEMMHIEKPMHPLFSIIDFSKITYSHPKETCYIHSNLYNISVKSGADCILQYGPHHFDFTQGAMSFFKPGQTIKVDPNAAIVKDGFTINFHPDFLRTFPLDKKIQRYDFFDYKVNEALFLSDEEKAQCHAIAKGIETEYKSKIDSYSQEAIVSFLDLLLVYGKRFYDRQFITRKTHQRPIVVQFEELLDAYFHEELHLQKGLPNVKYFAEAVHMSPNYLSDLLRTSTGKSAQSHIQSKLIEVAKTMLSSTVLSVSEIAYQLGFEQAQSFNRLFKSKTNQTPLEFRASFN